MEHKAEICIKNAQIPVSKIKGADHDEKKDFKFDSHNGDVIEYDKL